MARHRARHLRTPRSLLALALAPLAIAVGSLAAVNWPSRDAAQPPPSPPCSNTLRVVTAASFAPVLATLSPELERAEDCVRLDVSVADGRTAATRVGELGAHVWIPDDTSWAGTAGALALAPDEARAVIATSPIYLVTDPETANRVTDAGGSWLGLAGLAASGDVKLVLRDPAGSGDGMLAAGALGEAVWIDAGMDASARALAAALPNTRTASGVALPNAPGEVGLVPEYALPPALAARESPLVSLALTDHTALLRYTWLPTADAAADPVVAGAMTRTLEFLLGPQGADHLEAAGLRADGGEPPSTATNAGLPDVTAAALEVLGPHHVEHVFATWYVADRRCDLLVVIDVSGSMARPAGTGGRPVIDLVREGTDQLGRLLPDDSQLSVWEFGSQLQPPSDHRVLLPRGPLTPEHRQALTRVTGAMTAKRTGTGLYDTLLAAYQAARDGFRPGVPNHVLLFTDGRNQDDPGSITAEGLGQALISASDPARPVQLTVVTFGPEPQTDLLRSILKPVGGYVDPLTTADEIDAVFIHVAAGGLHS